MKPYFIIGIVSSFIQQDVRAGPTLFALHPSRYSAFYPIRNMGKFSFGGEGNMERKSLGTMMNSGNGQAPCRRNAASLSSSQRGSGDRTHELNSKTLGPSSIRVVLWILTILVVLLPTGGFGSPLGDELYKQPVPLLHQKIKMVADFYRAFHIYECLVDVRIEEGMTFEIELNNPNAYELKQMKDFLGDDFSNLKRYGFSKLSIRIGATRYVWEVK
jgi:hypothetical protein